MNKSSNRTPAKPETAKPRISKNVNSYQHFLQKPGLNQDNITWATNLRSFSLHKSLGLSQSTPQVFYKTTVSFENKLHSVRKTNIEAQKPSLNYAGYQHLLRKRLDKNACIENVNFQLGLRNRTDNFKIASGNKSPGFNTLPTNLRKEKIWNKTLKKVAIKKLRYFQDQDFEPCFDGYNNYPVYSQKILKEKNYNNYQHLSKLKGNGLPNLAWQIGLRNY